MKFNVRVALATTLLTCRFHLKSEAIVTPKYVKSSCFSKGAEPRKYSERISFHLRVTVAKRHVLLLKLVCQDFAQFSNESISFCNAKTSAEVFISRYSMQSSANNLTCDVILSTMSFIYNKNRSGPRTVPWGTPEITGDQGELEPFSTTRCFLSRRKDCQPDLTCWPRKSVHRVESFRKTKQKLDAQSCSRLIIDFWYW